MADRYRVPDPTCRHARSEGFVSYPAIDHPDFAKAPVLASTRVCGRTECIEDALAWVQAKTGHDGVHTTDAERAGKAGAR